MNVQYKYYEIRIFYNINYYVYIVHRHLGHRFIVLAVLSVRSSVRIQFSPTYFNGLGSNFQGNILFSIQSALNFGVSTFWHNGCHKLRAFDHLAWIFTAGFTILLHSRRSDGLFLFGQKNYKKHNIEY